MTVDCAFPIESGTAESAAVNQALFFIVEFDTSRWFDP
jgi:hypothetical protein